MLVCVCESVRGTGVSEHNWDNVNEINSEWVGERLNENVCVNDRIRGEQRERLTWVFCCLMLCYKRQPSKTIAVQYNRVRPE